MLTLALVAALASQSTDPAGRYVVETTEARCTLRLQASLPGLPEALLQGDAQSGFAFASPGCPNGLEAVSLWRLEGETQALSLIDGAGETLLMATRVERTWQGQTGDGTPVTLTRD